MRGVVDVAGFGENLESEKNVVMPVGREGELKETSGDRGDPSLRRR